MTYFCRDKFGKTMVMTAISKGYQRIIRMLYDYGNRNENVNLMTLWRNEYETVKTDQVNDESLSEFNFAICLFFII